MAERLKGDVAIEVDGVAYTFRFGGAALLAIEEYFPGEGWRDVLKRVPEQSAAGQLRMTDVAKLVRGGLRWHHPDLSLDEAAELAMSDGVQTALGEALQAAFPPATGGDGDADADPPKRGRRTGKSA